MENAKDDVKRYDAHYNAAAVEKLVKHFGLVMKDNDAKWVAVADPKEVERVEKWAEKHLGAGKDQTKSAVAAVAQEMHGDRHKNRVTFCYLLAKHLDRLDHLP